VGAASGKEQTPVGCSQREERKRREREVPLTEGGCGGRRGGVAGSHAIVAERDAVAMWAGREVWSPESLTARRNRKQARHTPRPREPQQGKGRRKETRLSADWCVAAVISPEAV
jgi:hypothetical protein